MKRKDVLYAFLLALVIATIWTLFNRYEYIGDNVYLFNRINVFPLTLWTIGLTILYIIHTKLPTTYRFIRITILYLVCLALLEAFGYHVLNIHLNSNEPSLFNLGIIHAPVHMKVFYIVAGPVYILIADLLLKKKREAQ